MEWAGVDGLQCEEEGERSQGPLAPRQQGQRLQAFARGLSQDLDTVVKGIPVVLGIQPQGGAAALEELDEELLEIHRD